MKRFDAPNTQNDVREATLDAAELSAMLQVAARETSDSVIITDRNFIVQWSNAAASEITGYSPEEMRGRNLLEMSQGYTTAPEVVAKMMTDLPVGLRFATSAWALRRNGERVLLDFEVIPYRGKCGAVTAFIGITRDITTRAQMEEASREAEERLRHAHRMIGVGTWHYFVDTKEIRWSEEIYKAFGRKDTTTPPTLEEYLAYLDPADRRVMQNLVLRAIQEAEPYEITFRINREDGKCAYMHGRASVRRDESGRVVELYGTTQDITKRIEAEKERLELHARLASAQRLESLGLLAGGIAHDFNNLLMGVMMTASVLEREVPPHSSISDAISNIQDAARRMAELTNQLLAYAGRGRFVLERVNPNEVTANTIETLRRSLNPEITLDSNIATTPTTVEIDPSQLRHVVANLISNASDSLEGRPGKISVRTYIEKKTPDAGWWILDVTDSGIGMAEDVQRRIFEPFFSTKHKGRGLGLSTVHGLVQRSRGSIDVQSVIGEGTRFSIRLPLVDITNTTSDARAETSTQMRPIRVLVADDEAMVRRSLRRMLELQRMNVFEATDGMAALELIEKAQEPFDFALLDIVMPRMTGYEVLAEIRTRQIPTKIILMSGFNSMDEVDGAKPPGHDADAMLQKPFAWDELRRAVRGVLGHDNQLLNDKR